MLLFFGAGWGDRESLTGDLLVAFGVWLVYRRGILGVCTRPVTAGATSTTSRRRGRGNGVSRTRWVRLQCWRCSWLA
jgi:hypothetical protein